MEFCCCFICKGSFTKVSQKVLRKQWWKRTCPWKPTPHGTFASSREPGNNETLWNSVVSWLSYHNMALHLHLAVSQITHTVSVYMQFSRKILSRRIAFCRWRNLDQPLLDVYIIYIMHVCIYTHWFLFAYLSMCIFNMRVGSCRNSLTCRSCLRDAPVCCRFASDPFASDLTQWTGIPFKLCLSSRWSVSSLGPSLRTSVANPPLTAAGEPDVPASWPQIQKWTSNWFLLIADLGWFGAEFRFQCFLELEVHYGSWLFPSHS